MIRGIPEEPPIMTVLGSRRTFSVGSRVLRKGSGTITPNGTSEEGVEVGIESVDFDGGSEGEFA